MQYYIPLSPVTLTHLFLGMFKSKKNIYDIVTPTEKSSVFVGVYNDEELISEVLTSILNQTEKPKEIIISDNGSIDNTLEEVQKFMKGNGYRCLEKIPTADETIELYKDDMGPKIKLLKFLKKTSKANSMNKAKTLGLIESPWCLTIDSDTYLKPDFLENLNKKRYQLRIKQDNSLEIIKSNVLGATVLTRYNKKSGLQERIIRRARDAEYSFGQILIRPGQNHTALFVAPGCGFMAYSEDLWMSNKTVVEDLEFTQLLQTKRSTKKVSLTNLEKILGEEFLEKSYIETKEDKKSLMDIFYKNGKEISYTQNVATYVPKAFMVTQDPKTIKSWAIQLERWNGGLQQLRYLEGKKIKKKPRLAWTMYGAYAEGLSGSLILLSAPIIPACFAYNNGSFDTEKYIKSMGTYLLADFAITSCLLGLSFYKRHRYEKDSKIKSALKAVKDVALCTAPFYFNRLMNSFEYLYGYAKNAYDYRIKKVKSWNSEWERPHVTEGAKKVFNEALYSQDKKKSEV